MRPRDRRFLEAIALLTVLPVLLVLRWTVDSADAAKVTTDRPEKVTVVPRGRIATWQNAKWKLYDQRIEGPPPGHGPEVAELSLAVAVKPLNEAGRKTLSSFGTGYRLADAQGHVWSGDGSVVTPRVGETTRLIVTAVLPRSKTGSVVLEVRPPEHSRPKGTPSPLLRFER